MRSGVLATNNREGEGEGDRDFQQTFPPNIQSQTPNQARALHPEQNTTSPSNKTHPLTPRVPSTSSHTCHVSHTDKTPPSQSAHHPPAKLSPAANQASGCTHLCTRYAHAMHTHTRHRRPYRNARPRHVPLVPSKPLRSPYYTHDKNLADLTSSMPSPNALSVSLSPPPPPTERESAY